MANEIHAYCMKTKEKNVVMVDAVITKTAKGGYMAQHEHTVVVTDDEPIILTSKNDIWS